MSEKAKGDIIYSCLECDEECKKGQRALLCDRCSLWTHSSCTDVEDDVYDLFFEKGSKLSCFRYFCKKCDNKVTEALEKYAKLEEDTKTLKSEMKVVQGQIADIQTTIKTAVKDNISTVMDDHRELEKRKMNLIVFGLPELMSENGQKQEWNTQQLVDRDIEEISKLITDELGVGLSPRNGILNARRLGGFKKNSDKPRPLRIEFKNLDTKRDVLTNAKKFRNSNVNIAKNIFINPDLTEKQRENDKILREKMWSQRQMGKNVIIKRGQLVEVDREVRKQRNSSQIPNTTPNVEKLSSVQTPSVPKDD